MHEKLSILRVKKGIVSWMNSSLKKKLVILFLMFAIIPSLIITYLSYDRASKTMVEEKIKRAEQDMQLFIRLVELRLKDFEEISQSIIYQPEFKKDDFLALTNSEQLFRINQLNNYLVKSMNEDEDIDSIYIIGKDFSVVPSSVKYNPEFLNEKIDSEKVVERQVSGLWCNVSNSEEFDTSLITLREPVYDKVTFSQLGVCVMNISTESIYEIYQEILGEYISEIIIVSQEGAVLYLNDSSDVDESLYDVFSLATIEPTNRKLYLENDYALIIRGKDQPFYYGVRVPIAHIYKESKALMTNVLLFLCFIIVIAVWFALSFAKQFIKPINLMVKTIRYNREGDLTRKIPILHNNEIGFLATNYNSMIMEIDQLIMDLDKQYGEKRVAELDALQSQITPHFLYNTLNSIRCMARIRDEEDIEKAITSTIHLLQLTISNKEVLVTIEDELAIVKNYLQLYAFRMNYSIKTNFNVDASLLECKTVKFTLQPFIENAIHHGIDVQSDLAQIDINIYRKSQQIYFEIIDNGVGMAPNQIVDLLEGNKTDLKAKFNGIGVKNVRERIRMHFGDDYGVTYDSVIGKGTKVLIVIPMSISKEDNYEGYDS